MTETRFDELTTKEQFIAAAAAYGITLDPHDFTGEPGALYIYGMPAAQWLDAMTLD